MNIKKISLKKQMRKTSAGKRQKGIALLFTLSILVILMSVVLLFSMRTTTSAKISVANTNLQRAQLMARSGLDQAIMAVNMSSKIPYVVSRGVDPTTGGTAVEATQTYDWIWKIENRSVYTINEGIEIRDYLNEMDLGCYPTWSYIRDYKAGDVWSACPIIGRYAFVAVTNSDKLDPNAIANHTYCNYNDEDCPDSDTETGLKSDHYRKGVSVAELWFDDSKLGKAAGRIDPWKLREAYKKNVDNISGWSGWTDWDTFLADVCGINSTDSDYDLIKRDLRKYFAFQSKDPEYFNYTNEKDATGHPGLKAMAHRFNLWRGKDDISRTENGESITIRGWETLTVDDLIKDPVMFYEMDGDELAMDDVGNYIVDAKGEDEGGIAWLANWSDEGDWHDVEATKKQIAANILNYCSSADREVVSDVDPDNWDGDNKPEYTGLKRTLYLNELAVSVEIVPILTMIMQNIYEGQTYEYDYSGTAHIAIEVVNMFEECLGNKNPGDYQVKVAGSFSFKCGFPDMNGLTTWETLTKDVTLEGSAFNSLTDTDGYQQFSLNTDIDLGSVFRNVTFPLTVDQNSFLAVKDVEFRPKYMILYLKDSTGTLKGVDFADLEAGADPAYARANFANGGQPAASDTVYLANKEPFIMTFSYQTEDPRQNLKPIDWNVFWQYITGEDFYDFLDVATVGSKNYAKGTVTDDGSGSQSFSGDRIDPSALGEEYDQELADDVVWDGIKPEDHISTAFIRHLKAHQDDATEAECPMESPWELGFIHRGSKWRTLNLSKVPDDGDSDDPLAADETGGGDYQDGDGHILDQVKMVYPYNGRDTKYSPKKVNLIVDKDENGQLSEKSIGYFALSALFSAPGSTSGNFNKGFDLVSYPGIFSNADIATEAESEGTQIPCVGFDDSATNNIIQYIFDDNAKIERRTDLYKIEDVRKILTQEDNGNVKTDAAREELFGRLLNLTKVSHFVDDVTILVIAQTIQDVGGENGAEALIIKDWNMDGADPFDANVKAEEGLGFTNAGYRRYQGIWEDENDSYYFINESDPALQNLEYQIKAKMGQYDNGADQITSEAKIRASVYYDDTAPAGTNHWKIKEFEYVDD